MIEVIKKLWEFDRITALALGCCFLLFLGIIGGHIWEYFYLKPKRKK